MIIHFFFLLEWKLILADKFGNDNTEFIRALRRPRKQNNVRK